MNPQNLLFLGLMIAVFYFMLIRPQQKRLRQHQKLVSSLAPGDEVVTIGGIFGYVQSMDDSMVWLEVAHGTVIRISRQAVNRKVPAPTPDELLEETQEGPATGEDGS